MQHDDIERRNVAPPPEPQDNDPLDAGGSVAHHIIDAFLGSLARVEGYADISKNLRKAIFDKKPTEANLRSALFGDDTF